MALKRKISKSTYDSLSEDMKMIYMADGDSYVLDLEGGDDVGELRRAKQREAQKAREEKARADKLQEELDAQSDSDARKRGDIEALEASWKEKNETETSELKTQLQASRAALEKTMIDGEVSKLASRLAGERSTIIEPHLRSRFAVDYDGDSPVLKVLGADGKPTVATVEDLEKEFVANKEFSSILVGSKASGSGAPADTKPKSGGGAPLDASGDKIEFGTMSVADKVAHIKAKKEAETN